MFQTLQFVNAALARVQPSLPPTAKLTANRLTFAAFPILGYSLSSDSMSQTQLWELANYTIRPRLNRVTGVAMVVLQGGKVPEFQIEPDPAKLLQAQVTVPAILDAVGKFMLPEAVKEGTAALGFPLSQAPIMGLVLGVCVVVYAIPRTAVLGALGITAYLGGAVTANMRVEAPLFSGTLSM